MNRKILIVNFNFPPSSSIGGRRWSYLAEGLVKLNFEIHVITSDFFEINKGESPWAKCISDFKKNITYLPHKTPYHVLNKTPSSFINKIRYKFSEKKAHIKKDANPYDRSIYFSQYAFDLALEKIKKLKIKNLILTGGPYDFLYRLSKLKVLFGNNLNWDLISIPTSVPLTRMSTPVSSLPTYRNCPPDAAEIPCSNRRDANALSI